MGSETCRRKTLHSEISKPIGELKTFLVSFFGRYEKIQTFPLLVGEQGFLRH